MDRALEKKGRARRLPADERRRQIVDLAFATVARSGLDALRTRDIAERASVNSATLHHYFSTKDELIAALAERLEYEYQHIPGATNHEANVHPALHALRQEFADAALLRRERPDVVAVAAEFLVRAQRDVPAARAVLAIHERWREQLEGIIRSGQEAGVFSADVDASSASFIVASALWGATSLFHARLADFRRVCKGLEAWLTHRGSTAREQR